MSLVASARAAWAGLMPRVAAFLRSPYAAVWAVFVVLRIASTMGVGIVRAPDTASWLTLDFSGSEIRLWSIPLFYKLLPADGLRVAGQVALGVAAWSALGAATVTLVRRPGLRLGAFAAILALGLTSQVLVWDTVLIGESVTISLSVAAIAAWLHFACAPGRASAVVVGVVMLTWAFTRHTGIVLTGGIALILAISLLWSERRRLRAAILVALVAMVAVGAPMLEKNQFNREETLATIVSERILPDPVRTQWFVDHGMPISPAIRRLAGSYFARGEGSTPIRENRRLWAWVQGEGRDDYLEYLLTHPGYALGQPVRATLDTEAVLSGRVDAYSSSRPVLPEPVQDLLWGDGPGALLMLASTALVVGLLGLWLRRLDLAVVVPALTVLVGGAALVLSYHGAGSEPIRHNLVSGVILRVGLLVFAVVAADRLFGVSRDGVRRS